jgi:hypothetical protein
MLFGVYLVAFVSFLFMAIELNVETSFPQVFLLQERVSSHFPLSVVPTVEPQCFWTMEEELKAKKLPILSLPFVERLGLPPATASSPVKATTVLRMTQGIQNTWLWQWLLVYAFFKGIWLLVSLLPIVVSLPYTYMSHLGKTNEFKVKGNSCSKESSSWN